MPPIILALTALAFQPSRPLPIGVTNNAVAAVDVDGVRHVYSLLGLDSSGTWRGVTSRSFAWTAGEPGWREIPGPPGPGRLAATAQSVRGRVYLFGGYTVAEDGGERSVPRVDILDPGTEQWTRGRDIPLPVDDAVSGVWRDSLIFLVSGWHDRDNVADVQIYDPATDRWRAATPIPGTPVFGHAGGIAGDVIIYVDGVRRNPDRPRYTIEPASWRGDIDPADPARIVWTRLPPHPGPPVYRAAALGIGPMVIVAGGTDNPYNYTGIGYNGVPSVPSSRVFGYNIRTNAWVDLPPLQHPSMDHRGLVRAGRHIFSVGGLGPTRTPLREVNVLSPPNHFP